jgi:predicted metalloprotease with PDZ domain
MDDLFVYRAGLSTLEEYLDFVRGHLDGFFSTPGRRFHSLEDSSYNAWIKLYRPDENLRNSSVSYYLKGGLVFMALHADLRAKGKGIDDLLAALWEDYKARPASGVTKEMVYGMVEKIGGAEVLGRFQTMVETTQDIDFSAVLGKLGLELVWQEGPPSWLGVEWDFFGDRAIVRTVLMDSPGAKSGLNAGDEIIALNGLRVLKDDVEKWGQVLRPEQPYELWLTRLGKLTRLELTLGKSPLAVKEIRVVDRQLAVQALGGPVQSA